MKKDLVKQSNSLTEAFYNLSTVEYRVLRMAFSALAECETNPSFFRNVRMTVKASDYAELYEVDKNTAYQALREASERLFNRYFTYDTLVNADLMLYERIKSRWVTKIGYIENQAVISFYLTDDVLNMVGNLKQQYTYFNLSQTIGLNSFYAVRVYEMLMQWRSSKQVPSISIADLRGRLGIADTEYPRVYDFKKYVIDTALRQINETTGIIASYEQIKQGKTVIGFTFSYKDKKKKDPLKTVSPAPQDRDPDCGDMFTTDGLSDAQLARIANNPLFIAHYNHLLDPMNPANQNPKLWTGEMVKRLKANPDQFNRQPLRDYLDY